MCLMQVYIPIQQNESPRNIETALENAVDSIDSKIGIRIFSPYNLPGSTHWDNLSIFFPLVDAFLAHVIFLACIPCICAKLWKYVSFIKCFSLYISCFMFFCMVLFGLRNSIHLQYLFFEVSIISLLLSNLYVVSAML